MVAATARLTRQENQNVPLGFPFEVGSEGRSGKLSLCAPCDLTNGHGQERIAGCSKWLSSATAASEEARRTLAVR